jgi:ComF family protein
MDIQHTLFRYLPHQCSLCLSPSNHYLCFACQSALPRINHACRTCGLPLDQNQGACGDCLTHPKPYTHTICSYVYDHPVDYLLKQFKDHRPLVLAQFLLPSLLTQLTEHYRERAWPELLIPIPIHWTKLLRRGFNQAQVLSQQLTQHTSIPTQLLLKRPLRLHDQKALRRQQRLKNLKRAFVCDGNLEGRHVAVIDDVITTCSTVMCATEALQRAGAGQVDVWALARTP